MVHADTNDGSRGLLAVLAGWLVLAGVLAALARPNTSVPGLFYDEALCAGMARDFLTGRAHPHTPGSAFVDVAGRPFPTFVQSYGAAVKSWLLLPSFSVFGASQAVLRATALGFGLLSLLGFLLWARRWLGTRTALLAGALLALDPTFFFVNVLDWGPVFPSFLCRFACFYFALRWWQDRGALHAFLAGLFAGVGFLNKVDFAVILAAVPLALACCHAREVRAFLAERRFAALVRPLALASVGFLLAAGPILAHVPAIAKETLQHRGDREAGAGELREKVDAALAMYDGTYFYRLMEHGGRFDRMFGSRAPLFAPLGAAAALASAVLLLRGGPRGRSARFVALSAVFVTIGVFALPGAVRIHHMVAVYPFPHLAIALAITSLTVRRSRLRSVAAGALVALLLGSQVAVLLATQRLIAETGGRGWWSDALNAFAREVEDRSDLTIVSLDWGFNEQLAFLTDGPALAEPFWALHPATTRSADAVYLVHPPEYSLRGADQALLDEARRAGPERAEVRGWSDRQGRVAFYSLRFR
jgi:hypothetical protein